VFKAKDYRKAESLQEAWELNQKKSNLLVGGMMWTKMYNSIKLNVIDLSGLGLDRVEEDGEEFWIGCMCTLRTLETHEGLNHCFQNVFRECTRHIVGVQFRNTATVGGSVYGRFGFSDILTCLLALDTWVELYKGGMVPLSEFVDMPFDRDILVRVVIKKDGRRAGYASQRLTQTDFPVIACGAARKDDTWYFSVGARPSKAGLYAAQDNGRSAEELAAEAADAFSYGTNLWAGGEYRRHLAEVYIRRLIEQIAEGGR